MNFHQLRRALPHLDELRLWPGLRADGAVALPCHGCGRARAVLCAVER